jgi:hypothetical protein
LRGIGIWMRRAMLHPSAPRPVRRRSREHAWRDALRRFFWPTNLDRIFMLFEFRRVQEAEASRLGATR